MTEKEQTRLQFVQQRVNILQRHIDDLRKERDEVERQIFRALNYIQYAKRTIYDLEKDDA